MGPPGVAWPDRKGGVIDPRMVNLVSVTSFAFMVLFRGRRGGRLRGLKVTLSWPSAGLRSRSRLDRAQTWYEAQDWSRIPARLSQTPDPLHLPNGFSRTELSVDEVSPEIG